MASPSIDVYVKLASGRTSAMQMWPADLVSKICDQIAEEENVESHRVRLKYQGKVLSRTSSIGYLGICAETILKGEIIIPRHMTIKVGLPDGGCEEIHTQNVCTVSDIKDKLDLLVPRTERVVLKLGDRVLSKGDQCLYELGISDGCELLLETVKTTVGSNTSETQSGIDEKEREKLFSSFEDAGGRNVEVVFSFDSTGSMACCLELVRAKLKESCIRLIRDIPNIRIGLMAHLDYDYDQIYGEKVLRSIDLTSDTEALVDFASAGTSKGGQSSAECYEWALRKAQGMDWSENAAKALVVIGDEIPHEPQFTDQAVNWHTELDVLKGMGVKVYGVQARNNGYATPFYEELAERTEGYYLNLTQFDAIPDMFLAVCYREADTEQFEVFVEEMGQDGRMNNNTAAIVNKLKQAPPRPKTQKRYVREAWWDPTLCRLPEPQFIYHANEDRWESFSKVNATAGMINSTKTEPARTKPVAKSRRSYGKRLCCVM
ncbi:hypothetical protein ScPMuIL_018658 [Solemya velum]